jgi:hypothetical protein
MYVQRSVEARSHNHRCRGKAIFVTYSERVSAVWLSHIFAHYLINGKIFKKIVVEHKMWILIFYNFV